MGDLTAVRSTSIPPRSRPSRARGLARPIAEVDDITRSAMFELFETYYANASRTQFEADLGDKEWAIILEDVDDNRVCGFTTLALFDAEVRGEHIAGIASGDTIVDRDYWGETALARVWSRKAFELAGALAPQRVFWLLICSGYKTYRFLPVFYREFYPRFDASTPPELREIVDALATERYADRYDPTTGVVRFATPTPLRDGVAAVTDERLRDPHVSYFHHVNSGHGRGDELVCLTELIPGNLTPAGRRMLYGRP